MSQTYNDIDQATDTGTQVFTKLDDRTDTLRSTFSGTSLDGSPVVGEQNMHLDGSASGYDVWKAYYDPEGSGDAWYECGSVLHTDLTAVDGNHELIGWRFENTGTAPTPGAGTVGQVILDTSGGTNRMKVVRDASTLDTVMHGNAAEYIAIDLPIGSWDFDATNPPTATTVGTTPTIRGWAFNATNEQMSTSVRIPDGFSDTADCKLRFYCALESAETASDTIDATFDYVVLTPDNNEVLTKTSTQSTVSESIAANNSQYALHQFDFTIDYDDANNPIDAGDLLIGQFALSSVASVAGIIVVHAVFLVPFGGTILDT